MNHKLHITMTVLLCLLSSTQIMAESDGATNSEPRSENIRFLAAQISLPSERGEISLVEALREISQARIVDREGHYGVIVYQGNPWKESLEIPPLADPDPQILAMGINTSNSSNAVGSTVIPAPDLTVSTRSSETTVLQLLEDIGDSREIIWDISERQSLILAENSLRNDPAWPLQWSLGEEGTKTLTVNQAYNVLQKKFYLFHGDEERDFDDPSLCYLCSCPDNIVWIGEESDAERPAVDLLVAILEHIAKEDRFPYYIVSAKPRLLVTSNDTKVWSWGLIAHSFPMFFENGKTVERESPTQEGALEE